MKSARRPRLSRLRPLAALVLVAGFLVGATVFVGCQRTAKVKVPVAAVFDGARTYAWSGVTPASERIGDPSGQDEVEALLRQELDGQLAANGFEKVSAASARFHAALYLGVEKDSRTMDPQFSVYTAERIERGHALMTLTVSMPAHEPTWDRSEAPAKPEPAWIASTESVLRVTARGMGQSELRWTGTEEVRDWRVRSMASSLGKRLP